MLDSLLSVIHSHLRPLLCKKQFLIFFKCWISLSMRPTLTPGFETTPHPPGLSSLCCPKVFSSLTIGTFSHIIYNLFIHYVNYLSSTPWLSAGILAPWEHEFLSVLFTDIPTCPAWCLACSGHSTNIWWCWMNKLVRFQAQELLLPPILAV